MGRTRAADETEMTAQARDLSAAVHSRRTTTEGNSPMSQDRLLLRPADPTRRPRFDAEPGTRIDPVRERNRSRRLLAVVLVALALVTLGLTALAVTGLVDWWAHLLGLAGIGVYLIGLRRAELGRRARATRAATRAREQRAREETARRREAGRLPSASTPAVSAPAAQTPSAPVAEEALEASAERAAEQLARPGEWTPRPVPLPTYALRGEVDDLATRHAAHRRSMAGATVPLEAANVEELEAVDETFAPAQDLHLDEILARRRA